MFTRNHFSLRLIIFTAIHSSMFCSINSMFFIYCGHGMILSRMKTIWIITQEAYSVSFIRITECFFNTFNHNIAVCATFCHLVIISHTVELATSACVVSKCKFPEATGNKEKDKCKDNQINNIAKEYFMQ